MQLLVSVADPSEAGIALAGGADLVDAKDPRRGSLGAVAPEVLHAIIAAVGGRRPTSAALGDATETGIHGAARAAIAAGVRFVKVGFLGTRALAGVRRLAAAAARGLGPHAGTALILVSYADWERANAPPPAVVLEGAIAVGAAGVLLDTAFKDVGLFAVRSGDSIGRWVNQVRGAGLMAALAGGLREADLPAVRETGADWVGVRGAACEGGRTGRLSAARVAALSDVAHDPTGTAAGARV